MSMQLNEMGAWFFLRIREWGIGRVGINLNWAEHQFWKNVFWISWEINTKNDHLSLMRQRFTFPHDWEWKNNFEKTNWAFTQQQARKTDSEFEPFRNFSCPIIWIFPLLGNFVLSHVFSCLLVVFLNTIALNPIWCLCFERPAICSFWYFCSSRSGTDNVQNFVNLCVCM